MSKAHEETGYVPIKNYLLERIYQSDLTATQFRILLCLARLTYGWKEKGRSKRRRDRVSVSYAELAQRVGVSNRSVKRVFSELVERQIILVHTAPTNLTPGTYGINSDPEHWSGGDKCDTSGGDKCDTSGGDKCDTSGGDRCDTPGGDRCDTTEVTGVTPLEVTGVTPLEVTEAHLQPPLSPHNHAPGATPKESIKERSKEIPPIIPQRGSADESDFTDPEKLRHLELENDQAATMAGRYLERTFSTIPSPTEHDQLQLYLADEAPNGYKLAVLAKATQELVKERAEMKARGDGRFVSRRPIEKAISAAGERLAANKLQILERRKQAERRASQPGIGESESIEQYKRRIGAI